jgi:predicted HicB family RNase H-like nuclease
MSEKTLAHRGYCGSIEVSLEDNCLHGKVLFIHDLVTYEADSASALRRAFHDAVDYYLDKCAREGKDAEQPFSGSTTLSR